MSEYVEGFEKGKSNHTKEELNDVALAAQSGDPRAAKALGELMQPYVIGYLRRVGRGSNYTVDQRNEMTQEAWVGVWEALERWDPSQGVKFSTYAHHWQRHYVMEWVSANTRSLRLPRKSWHYGLLIKEAWAEEHPGRELWEATPEELRNLEVMVQREGEATKLKFDGGQSGKSLDAVDIVRALRQPHTVPSGDDVSRSSQSAEADYFDTAMDVDQATLWAIDDIRTLLDDGDEEGARIRALDLIEDYDLADITTPDHLLEVSRIS